MKKIKPILSISLSIMSLFILSCSKDDCEYTSQNCVEECKLIENFEDDSTGSLGNWNGIAIRSGSSIIQQNGSNVLFADDGPGASWIYNTTDFPSDLISEGCELKYEIQYVAGSSNSTTTDNSITLFIGSSPAAATQTASFTLDPTNLIVSGDPIKTIIVPLELATGTTLPSNSFGTWTMSGGPTYTSAQIADFNSLMQSNSGIAFFLDEGANPAEEWYYDNFCIKTCCPQ